MLLNPFKIHARKKELRRVKRVWALSDGSPPWAKADDAILLRIWPEGTWKMDSFARSAWSKMDEVARGLIYDAWPQEEKLALEAEMGHTISGAMMSFPTRLPADWKPSEVAFKTWCHRRFSGKGQSIVDEMHYMVADLKHRGQIRP